MANKDMKPEEISKAIEALVDEQLGKSMPVALDANGGKDKIKNDSPMTQGPEEKTPENQGSHTEVAGKLPMEGPSAKGKEKKDMKKSDEELKAEAEAVEKAKKEKEEKEKKEHDEKKEKEEKEKAMKAYKALGELADDEIELVKAWREEKALEEEEGVEKSMNSETLTKAISDAITSAVEPLKKALEEKDVKIGEMEKSLKKLASQPAYDKRSLSSLETVEKSGSEPEISKAQVANRMLELQLQGKGVRSTHIAEFETTGNISDPSIKKMVMDSFK